MDKAHEACADQYLSPGYYAIHKPHCDGFSIFLASRKIVIKENERLEIQNYLQNYLRDLNIHHIMVDSKQ